MYNDILMVSWGTFILFGSCNLDITNYITSLTVFGALLNTKPAPTTTKRSMPSLTLKSVEEFIYTFC